MKKYISKVLATSIFALLAIVCSASSPLKLNEFTLIGPKNSAVYESSFDVSKLSDSKTIFDFEGLYHEMLGKIGRTEDSIVYSNNEYVTYDSFWNPWQPNGTMKMHSNRYDTYTFGKFIDLPIEIYHTRRVAPNSSSSFTIKKTETESCSQEQTVETGNRYYGEYFTSRSFKLGGSIGLSNIKIQAEEKGSSSIKVGTEMMHKVTQASESMTSFSIVYKETFYFDNTNSGEYRYFQLNQRQKFKVYFTTNFGYNYDVTTTGSGLGGLDKHYSYEFRDFSGVCTKYFLLPVDDPYFEMSIYTDSSTGIKEYADNSHQYIYYI